MPGWMFVRADIIEDDADLFESQARNNSFTISSIPLPPSLFISLFSFSLSLSPSLPLSLLSLPLFDERKILEILIDSCKWRRLGSMASSQ